MQLVGIRGPVLEVLDDTGASLATQNLAITPTAASFVRFGAPGTEAIYVASSSATSYDTAIRKWDGAFSAVTPAGINPGLLGLQPTDNRLVVWDFDTTSNYSRIHFSDAGAPETFGADNYVELTPGDGEYIKAMATWRELFFVFKETKFFVFYGNSTDGTGGPEFNYRPVATGAGCVGSRATAIAPEGVYFCSRDGVYLTTGGPPRRVSDAIEPIFTGTVSTYFQSSALNQTQTGLVAMTYLNGRLYVSYPSGSATANDRTLVYDPRTEQWTLWDIPAAALASLRITDEEEELVFAYASGSNHIGRHSSSYTTDDGAAITSRYRTGFADLGTPGAEKRVREWIVTGVGSVGVSVAINDGSLDSATTVTLGTSPATDTSRRSKSALGRNFSVQLASVSGGAWTVNRLVAHITGERPPGLQSG